MTLIRMQTGISGLDEILHGGLMKAGVYLVRGEPGSGKTIFANQICFCRAATGAKVSYVTLLAESHGRMLEHLAPFSFYREDAIPSEIYYVSAFHALTDGGLVGVTTFLQSEVRTRNVELLVLDGLVSVSDAASSGQELKLFVAELQAYSALMGCTILLLNSVGVGDKVTPEQTMVDGIFRLRHELSGARHERSLEVVKFRGSSVVGGTHTLRFSDDGIAIYPRLEACQSADSSKIGPVPRGPALATGVPGLDELSEARGYPQASVTALSGAPGTGKTLLGLHFLGLATPEERALHFGFYESPALLIEVATNFGIDLETLRRAGTLEFIWQPYGALHLDELSQRLLSAVKRAQCKRVFIDGFGGFLSTPAFEERSTAFLGALCNELRRLGATTLIAVETQDPNAFVLPMPTHGISGVADNVVRLRTEETQGVVRRRLSLGKVRGSRIETALRELKLTGAGLRVVDDATNDDDLAED
ncbi:MAG: hypothetical protein H7125_03865 [Proteobacteria bacterium]|nr:hypothetical protein [Burkholderiales bacterium]